MKMKKVKNKKQLPSTADAFLSIRQTWNIKPVTHIKGDTKKENSKKNCRTKVTPT